MERILSTASGRYKALKLLQYISRFLLLLSAHKQIRLTSFARDKLRILTAQCSLQRRILQLGNLYRPLKSLLLLPPPDKSSRDVDWTLIASSIAALVEDASEDAFTLSQLGWLPERFTDLAIYADRAWLFSLLIDLYNWSLRKKSLLYRKKLERLTDQRPASEELTRRAEELREEEWWLDLDGVRTVCDAGQAWCDVFDVDRVDGFVVGCALTSAVLGMYRFLAKP